MAEFVDEWPTCWNCNKKLSYKKRADAIFCSDACRKASSRARAPRHSRRSVELWCEDALRWLPEHVNDESVDLVLTDFPYPNELADKGGFTAATSKAGGLYATLTPAAWPMLCAELFRVLKPGRRAFIWANNVRTLGPMDAAMVQAGFRVMREEPYEWLKVNAARQLIEGRYRHRTHELIASYGRPDYQGRVRDLHRPRLDNRMGAQAPRITGHTAKPVEILEIIRASTYASELVCDPFAGSGNTGRAARQAGRRSLLCEKDVLYAYAIARRLELADGITNYIAWDEFVQEHPDVLQARS